MAGDHARRAGGRARSPGRERAATLEHRPLAYSIVRFWAIFAGTPIVATASAVAVGALGGGVIVLPGAGWGLFWAIPLYLLAMDLAEYLFHRAQHAWPFLWAMHSLHHSDTALNITTTTRHFWIEVAIKLLFVYPFVSLLLSPSPMVLVAYAIAGHWNFVVHMNIRASCGRLWPMLNSPQYHRIHHAADLAYANCNFAALFPVFDVIFRTYHRPEKDEYPASGLEKWRSALRPSRGDCVAASAISANSPGPGCFHSIRLTVRFMYVAYSGKLAARPF